VTALEQILARDHADPHSFLGAHPQNGGVVVRVYRPGAEKLRVKSDAVEAELELLHPDGLFEGVLAGAELPLRYRLEVVYPSGTYTFADPYAFPPTLGELDVHHASEGRHEELYTTLGADVRQHDGVGAK
jgi:1,4-alpha-glucan branching enzyme